jgi:hypothetical protein
MFFKKSGTSQITIFKVWKSKCQLNADCGSQIRSSETTSASAFWGTNKETTKGGLRTSRASPRRPLPYSLPPFMLPTAPLCPPCWSRDTRPLPDLWPQRTTANTSTPIHGRASVFDALKQVEKTDHCVIKPSFVPPSWNNRKLSLS